MDQSLGVKMTKRQGMKRAPAQRADGFIGQVIYVLPPQVVEAAAHHPLTCSLYATDIGYFPKAAGHYRQRPQGARPVGLRRGWLRRRERDQGGGGQLRRAVVTREIAHPGRLAPYSKTGSMRSAWSLRSWCPREESNLQARTGTSS